MAIMNQDTQRQGLGNREWGIGEKDFPIPKAQSPIPSEDGSGPREAQDVEGNGLLLAEPEVKTKRPPWFKVVLLNDDYTPMDFVVFLIKDIFHRNHEDAVGIMLEIHQRGAGVCGVFTRD